MNEVPQCAGAVLPSENPKQAWQLWWLIAPGVFVIQLLTLHFDPQIHQDEIQIVDYGRTALEPDTDWGMTWNVNEDIPVMPPSYLASAFKELAFKVFGKSFLGPRILSVLAAILAATCALGWLRTRGTPWGVAAVRAVAARDVRYLLCSPSR
jgi:hypothetical protein